MKERSELEQFAKSPSIYAGESMNDIDAQKIAGIAIAVSSGLTAHADTMIQYPPSALFQSMIRGRAACALDSRGGLLAFAQYWPYIIDNTGDEFMRGLRIFEVGSWLSFANGQEKGHGKKVLEACLEAGNRQHPHAGFIAIVEQGNDKAAGILREIGGVKIGEKISKHVVDPNQNAARMSIFRMK